MKEKKRNFRTEKKHRRTHSHRHGNGNYSAIDAFELINTETKEKNIKRNEEEEETVKFECDE